jgi:hypothetical protein
MTQLGDPSPNTQKRARKPKEPAADILDMFRREDERNAIWGKPYTGKVRNTKHHDTPDA